MTLNKTPQARTQSNSRIYVLHRPSALAVEPSSVRNTLPPRQPLPRAVIDPTKPLLKLGLDVHLEFIMAVAQKDHAKPRARFSSAGRFASRKTEAECSIHSSGPTLVTLHPSALLRCRRVPIRTWSSNDSSRDLLVIDRAELLIAPSGVRVRLHGMKLPKKPLRVGDKVSWNTPQGRTSGVVKKKLTTSTRVKAHKVSATKQNPEYLVESAKSGQRAAHKGAALKKAGKTERQLNHGWTEMRLGDAKHCGVVEVRSLVLSVCIRC